jgi:hypothetical protein
MPPIARRFLRNECLQRWRLARNGDSRSTPAVALQARPLRLKYRTDPLQFPLAMLIAATVAFDQLKCRTNRRQPLDAQDRSAHLDIWIDRDRCDHDRRGFARSATAATAGPHEKGSKERG